MSKADFLQDLRVALRQITPSTDSDYDAPTAVMTARMARAALWFTPKCVEAYNPDDFADAPAAHLAELSDAVERFRAEAAQASELPLPVPDDEYHRGLRELQRIASAIRAIMLPEWLEAVEQLVDDAESWSANREWPHRREQKPIRETLLGDYEVPQLLIQAERIPMLLDPVARFVVGGDGLIELAVMPSYARVMIARLDDQWQLHIERGKRERSVERKPWSEQSFYEAVDWLRRKG